MTGEKERLQRRMRRGGAAVVAAVAVALIAAVIAIPGASASGSTRGASHFDALVPYASFGWLPAGWYAGASRTQGPSSGMAASSTQGLLEVPAWGPGGGATLWVNTAGNCRLRGDLLSCAGDTANQWRIGKRAPDVNGRRAYRMVNAYWNVGANGAAIGWEYGSGAWVVVGWGNDALQRPPRDTKLATLSRIAAAVRLGESTPMKFPYTVSGLAGSWRVSEAVYTIQAGQPVPIALTVDNGSAGTAHSDISLWVSPASSPPSDCLRYYHQFATLDGTRAGLETTGGYEQALCDPKVDGLQVQVQFDPPMNRLEPDATGTDGVLGIARKLHLLGPDHANWAANPVR